MHVAVLGAGSLGSLVGGLLSGDHRVTLVGREDHVRAVATGGLRITGAFDRTAHPAATTSWQGVEDPDVAIVAVKSYDTRGAAEELARSPPPTVLSVQNGLGPVGTLEEVLGHRAAVLSGVATYGAILEAPGEVRCTGRGEVVLGDPAGGRSPSAERIGTAWRDGDLACEVATDMPRRRWRKVAINAAINPTTALARVRNGAVLEDPIRPIALAAAREAVRVARGRGTALDLEDTLATVEAVARRTAENQSSMARDVARGSRTEIEAITGAVIDRAEPEDVPVNRVLYGLVIGYERGAERGDGPRNQKGAAGPSSS